MLTIRRYGEEASMLTDKLDHEMLADGSAIVDARRGRTRGRIIQTRILPKNWYRTEIADHWCGNGTVLRPKTHCSWEAEQIDRLSGHFARRLAFCGSARQGTVLQDHKGAERFLRGGNGPVARRAVLRQLADMDRLGPIPEIFWKVDRTGLEYEQRFGLPLEDLLRLWSPGQGEDPATLLEFGQGNGTAKRERELRLGDRYMHLGLCRELLWPVAPLVRRLVDTDDLSEEETRYLADALHQILVTTEDGMTGDRPVYDPQAQALLRKDPENIRRLLREKGHRLAGTDSVFEQTGVPDGKGGVAYPHRTPAPDTAAYRALCDRFAADPDALLRDGDVRDMLPVHPAGTLIGDFTCVENWEDGQIDVALGVRSTQYLQGEEYERFMRAMARKLTEDGIYLDDNPRENHGAYYRIAALLRIQRAVGFPLHVLTGDGQPGEDSRPRGIPAAVVMTRCPRKREDIACRLRPGFALRTLDELASDDAYLASLTPDGRVLRDVRAEREAGSPT